MLRAERRLRGTPKGSRALTPFRQAVMVLCWFRGDLPAYQTSMGSPLTLRACAPINSATWSSDSPMSLGAAMHGDLDETRVYQQALTAA
ncbi:hypothetical protein [Nonomuraea sp. NPDC046570]|uniref:hypothetical protein n=1 Tax=Nonomuraea sp. NPDC046570 TaxID=3155255 RepID=UPI0033D799B1